MSYHFTRKTIKKYHHVKPSHCYQAVVVHYFHDVIPLSNQYDQPLYQPFLSISTILVPVSILIVTISWVITLT